MASQDDLKAATEFIRTDTGYLNLVVANAGINDRSALEMGVKPSVDDFQKFACSLEQEDWSKVFNVNVTSAFFTVASMLDLLALGNVKHNVSQSSQVVVTSAAGAFLRGVPPGGFAYALSKAAVTHLFKMLATILAPQKIRFNIICPGCKCKAPEVLPKRSLLRAFELIQSLHIFTNLDNCCPFPVYHSEMADPIIQHIVDADAEGKVSVVPEGRVGSREDMAGAILFLASRAGSFCNGTVLVTDGGTISQEPAVY